MTALAHAKQRKSLTGVPYPRIAPPVPLHHRLPELEACAADLGITFMEWQRIAGKYLTAVQKDKTTWLYRRFAAIVARQNGKTEIIKPRTLLGFKLGRKMLHLAQDRARPRKSTFVPLVEYFAKERNREAYDVRKIREANGQEEIICWNGASYSITAPTSGGARGDAVDDIFVDEVREFEDFVVDGIIRPTITARPNAQIDYFSNAGHAGSVILNDLRTRMGSPNLAYLEWSAAPERERSDEAGWAEANPALGTTIDIETLRDFYETMEPAIFETEHLCRWVTTTRPTIVGDGKWEKLRANLDAPMRATIGIKVDAHGRRASAVAAWQMPDGFYGVRSVLDVTGDPVNVKRFAEAVQVEQRALRAFSVVYDPWTDGEAAKYFKSPKAVNGRDYANSSGTFSRLVQTEKIQWDGDDVIGPDLPWTIQKPNGEKSFMAVPAQDDHPVTAVEAAIRAVGAVAGPAPQLARIN
jgi:hypothetical protein